MTSNIAEVIEEMEGVMSGIEPATERALDPASWAAVARNEAQIALLAVAESPLQRKLAMKFLRLIEVRAFPNGMEWSLEGAVEALDEFWVRFGTRDVSREMVQQWVEQAKDKTSDKAKGLSDEEITANILGIIFAKDRTPARDASARALVYGKTGSHGQSILQYAITNDPEMAGMDEETVGRWLETILEAWSEAILDQVPSVILKNLA